MALLMTTQWRNPSSQISRKKKRIGEFIHQKRAFAKVLISISNSITKPVRTKRLSIRHRKAMRMTIILNIKKAVSKTQLFVNIFVYRGFILPS